MRVPSRKKGSRQQIIWIADNVQVHPLTYVKKEQFSNCDLKHHLTFFFLFFVSKHHLTLIMLRYDYLNTTKSLKIPDKLGTTYSFVFGF